ncbi:hypothetical protein [Streptomyces chilikensis]|uniref:hypothetical protein n=1 Tax=Streptomyces chilikensis TaxID=1194079 RepID=UPI000A8B989D|nr:hypothetical protein [Streptomyces chilikensis]
MTNGTIGAGKAVHLIIDGKPGCGRAGAITATDAAATCKTCIRVAPAEPVAEAAPVTSPAKPKAKKAAPKKAAPKKTTTKKAAARKPRKTKPRGETKVFASGKTADLAAGIPGVRWAGIARQTGTLTASVKLADFLGKVVTGFQWAAACIDHDEYMSCQTHRAAWIARRSPAEWCKGCASALADTEAKAAE